MIVLVFHLFFSLLIFFLCLAFWTGAPFVPSKKNTARSMIRLAKLRTQDTVYDLGSGDGRLLFLAGALGVKRAVGVEINPWLVLFTNIKIFFSPEKKRLFCFWGDFWRQNLRDADVVFVYLLPWRMQDLERKLKKELKKGSRVVSNSFIFPGWKCDSSDEKNHVYVFTV